MRQQVGVELLDSGLFFAEIGDEDHPVRQGQTFLAKLSFLSFGLLSEVSPPLIRDGFGHPEDHQPGGKFFIGPEKNVLCENMADSGDVLAGESQKIRSVSFGVRYCRFGPEATEVESSSGGDGFETQNAAVGQVADEEISRR